MDLFEKCLALNRWSSAISLVKLLDANQCLVKLAEADLHKADLEQVFSLAFSLANKDKSKILEDASPVIGSLMAIVIENEGREDDGASTTMKGAQKRKVMAVCSSMLHLE